MTSSGNRQDYAGYFEGGGKGGGGEEEVRWRKLMKNNNFTSLVLELVV